ncbi:MAG: hypothetical protein GXO49_01365 [Chlorobi bacterium]|nr:hypothetical protein [Chlorobiota bacterium]
MIEIRYQIDNCVFHNDFEEIDDGYYYAKCGNNEMWWDGTCVGPVMPVEESIDYNKVFLDKLIFNGMIYVEAVFFLSVVWSNWSSEDDGKILSDMFPLCKIFEESFINEILLLGKYDGNNFIYEKCLNDDCCFIFKMSLISFTKRCCEVDFTKIKRILGG